MKDRARKIMLFTIIISIITIICLIIGMVIEINKMYEEYREQVIAIKSDDDSEDLVDDYEEANSDIGKTVEEIKEEEQNADTENEIENTEKTEKTNFTNVDKNVDKTTETKEETIVEKDPEFEMPVEGEIIKEYSSENLVYSETLKEWTTHMGIDIAAEMTTVVKAAEEGTVTAIKNDPRYGITVIISHTNGYETRYSNLLTAEFVTVGEQVTKGQTIGTVGNTASFEIADNSHLHFEILKDSVNVDPLLYIN